MKLLLDSTILIDVLRERQGRRMLLAKLAIRGEVLATSAISIGEVYSGLRPAEELRAETFFSSLEIYPVTKKIARLAGSLRYASARQGATLALADTIVAATALEYGMEVMTDNRKDFPMPELKLFDLP